MKFLRAILFFAATLLLYLGVPLLGWGLGELADFFSVVPRLGYAIGVALFSLAVGVQAYSAIEGIVGQRGVKEKLVFRQTVVRIALEASLYIALFFIPFLDHHNIAVFSLPTVLGVLGAIFSMLGFGLIFTSGVALGRQYSADVTIQEDHHLVTTGIYRLIRNPRYLGIIALVIGYFLVFRSWIGLFSTPLVTSVLIFRIQDEESAMRKEFGSDWEAYCLHSWRLIPYVY